MAKGKKFGFVSGLSLIIFCGIVGAFCGQEWISVGVGVGIVLCVIATRGNKPKSSVCDICSSPVIYQSYEGTVNGQHFDTICAKCKNHLTNQIRKEKMSKILGEEGKKFNKRTPVKGL